MLKVVKEGGDSDPEVGETKVVGLCLGNEVDRFPACEYLDYGQMSDSWGTYLRV